MEIGILCCKARNSLYIMYDIINYLKRQTDHRAIDSWCSTVTWRGAETDTSVKWLKHITHTHTLCCTAAAVSVSRVMSNLSSVILEQSFDMFWHAVNVIHIHWRLMTDGGSHFLWLAFPSHRLTGCLSGLWCGWCRSRVLRSCVMAEGQDNGRFPQLTHQLNFFNVTYLLMFSLLSSK